MTLPQDAQPILDGESVIAFLLKSGIINEAQASLARSEATEWLTLAQAARVMGMTRQNAHLMARDGKFESLHTIARGTILVVAEEEVLAMAVVRTEVKSA
jgi:hypothetical protein